MPENRFPQLVQDAMTATGSVATCIPVALDGAGAAEAAFFVSLAGKDSQEDRRRLRTWTGPLPIDLETEVARMDQGTVVMLRAELALTAEQPFSCEVLLMPGQGSAHFEVLKLLTRQPRLTWFLGDGGFRVLRTQQHALDDAQRAVFEDHLREAAAHDAVVRMTGHYDGRAALQSFMSRYARVGEP